MRDLLIITPTRGRPDSARRLIDAVAATRTADTCLALAMDDDDRSYDDPYWESLPDWVDVIRGPRQGCPAWTNQVADMYQGGFRALASLGDDHVPETLGWDTILLGTIDAMGGTGLAFGDDCLQHELLATAPVISADIVQALGWFMLPGIKHVYADNIWMEIAQGAGCLRYVPDVVIRHLHWSAGTAPMDQLYAERGHLWAGDEQTWRNWQAEDKAIDVEKVRALVPAGGG
jgi:hypothetical protein